MVDWPFFSFYLNTLFFRLIERAIIKREYFIREVTFFNVWKRFIHHDHFAI